MPPVTHDDSGGLHGVEAVLGKDLIAALLAAAVGADALLILADVPAVIRGYGTAGAQPIRSATVLSSSVTSPLHRRTAVHRFAGEA